MKSLFSYCTGILPESQSTITPYMFECLVNQKANQNMWSVQEVSQATRSAKDNNHKKEEIDDYKEYKDENEIGENE